MKACGFGLKMFTSDPWIFVLTSLEGKEVGIVVGVYVDDFFVTGKVKTY